MMTTRSHITPVDLIRFHRLEREFYYKLVNDLNQNKDDVKWVLSLWLWFESIGNHDFIRYVSSFSDQIIVQFVEEGKSCLGRLLGRVDSIRGSDELPLTMKLVKEPIDLKYFDHHREMAIERVSHFYEKVGKVVFDDNVEDSRREESGMDELQKRLNPMAQPWSPEVNVSPEDQRSMFITFSRGYPLTREEIMEFFITRYGQCVEMVMIEKTAAGSQPMYGRVVFKKASMIAKVLNGQRTAKFLIKGRHLWARLYVPRPTFVSS